MKLVKYVFLSLGIFLCSHTYVMADEEQQESLEMQLPFSSIKWDNMKLQFWASELQYEYESYLLDHNPILVEHFPIGSLNFGNFYFELETNKNFKSYIVDLDGFYYFATLDHDGNLLDSMSVGEFVFADSEKRNSFIVDNALNIHMLEESVYYSEVNANFFRNQKLYKKVYQVKDDGKIEFLSEKQFPDVVTDYNPANSDNCFQRVANYTLDYLKQAKLPLNNDLDYVSDSIEPEGIGSLTLCHSLAYGYLWISNTNDYTVYLFSGMKNHWARESEDSHDSVYYGILYLVTVKDHQVKDVMPIYYNKKDENKKIEFTINKDVSIDLIMTDEEGEKRTETYHINQNGEFE